MTKQVPEELQKVFDWIDGHRDEAIADLQKLVQQPSISSQNVGLEECADLLVEMMHTDGLDAKVYPLEQGPPVVIGMMPSKQTEKVLLTYAHYDVQPPEPLEKWTHEPFGGEIADGKMWGRGATDNKGGVLAIQKAAKAWLQVHDDLPVGLRFFIEGEEEIGSLNLGPFVMEHPELFEANAMHCLDGGLNASELTPDIDLGLKSVMYVELIARGAKTDVHSLNAPLVPQPAWELVRALNSLVGADRRIKIKDWYEGLWELGEEEMQQLEENERRLDLDKLKEELGVDEFALGREGIEALKARAYEPTCNICGLTSGYQGPGGKTIVPNEARAKIDFRLPPLLNPENCLKRLRKHLDENGFENIEIDNGGRIPEPPYKISVKEDISQSIIAAAELVYGKSPVVNGVSAEGTILKHVWMPTVLTGFAEPDCNLHAPDENIGLDSYIKGIKYAAAIFWMYGKS
ncbi:MAG: M20/M25/M40 family metallo-hydrolase [Anaerolineaceae bacterium]|nr:M20/M25/M40 family metallo-hydrolase [Anaerolineaceae bacterium]